MGRMSTHMLTNIPFWYRMIQNHWSTFVDNEPLTIKQVARELEVDDKTVRRWIKSGQLEATQDIVGRYKIARADLNAFVERRRRQLRGEE